MTTPLSTFRRRLRLHLGGSVRLVTAGRNARGMAAIAAAAPNGEDCSCAETVVALGDRAPWVGRVRVLRLVGVDERPHSRARGALGAPGLGIARLHSRGRGCVVAPAREPLRPVAGTRGCGLVPLESLLGESCAPVHGRDRVRSLAGRGFPARVPRVSSGRLEHSFERVPGAGYFIAFGVQLAGMTLGRLWA